MATLREQIIPRRKLLLMASETALVAGVMLVGTSVPPLTSASFYLDPGNWSFWHGLLSCVFVAVLCQASLSYNDLYDWKVAQNRGELPNRLLHAAGYALVMMALAVVVAPSLFYFPGLGDVSDETWKIIVLVGVAFVAVGAWRIGFHWFFYKWNFGERVLVFGAGPKGHAIARMVVDHPFSGFEIVGLVRADSDPVPDPAANAKAPAERHVLGDGGQLAALARAHRVARVIVALEERRGTLPVEDLLDCRMDGIQVEEKETMYERLAGKIAVESLRPSYLIFGKGFGKHRIATATKRCIDLLASLTGLLLASPICVLTALLIKLDSRGPVFFRQERVGEDGAPFMVLKFRTMRTDAEADGPKWALQNDDRVTRIGRLLRRSRIDEIPQMLNVLAGKMSFVGPRPERPVFVEQLQKQIPYYRLRHTVKPGLTGWAQVNYPYGASVEDAAEKLRYDLYYVKYMSPLFDLNIILRTVGVILFGKGSR
jgi:sugar transferase (PEP-CTERM system associated)